MQKIWYMIYKDINSPTTISFEFTESEVKDESMKAYMEHMFEMKAKDLKMDLQSLNQIHDKFRILKQKDAWSYEFKLTGPSVFNGLIKKELLDVGFVVNRESWKERFPTKETNPYTDFISD